MYGPFPILREGISMSRKPTYEELEDKVKELEGDKV